MPSEHWTPIGLFLSTASYSSCCCSGAGVSTSHYPPHLPFCSFITAVLQPCLGGSHSIVALCSCRCWLRSAQPARWKRLAPSHCNTWHLVASGRLELSVLSPWTQRKTVFCRPPPSCLCFAAGLPVSAALKPNCWTQPQVLDSFFFSLSLSLSPVTLLFTNPAFLLSNIYECEPGIHALPWRLQRIKGKYLIDWF